MQAGASSMHAVQLHTTRLKADRSPRNHAFAIRLAFQQRAHPTFLEIRGTSRACARQRE